MARTRTTDEVAVSETFFVVVGERGVDRGIGDHDGIKAEKFQGTSLVVGWERAPSVLVVTDGTEFGDEIKGLGPFGVADATVPSGVGAVTGTFQDVPGGWLGAIEDRTGLFSGFEQPPIVGPFEGTVGWVWAPSIRTDVTGSDGIGDEVGGGVFCGRPKAVDEVLETFACALVVFGDGAVAGTQFLFVGGGCGSVVGSPTCDELP